MEKPVLETLEKMSHQLIDFYSNTLVLYHYPFDRDDYRESSGMHGKKYDKTVRNKFEGVFFSIQNDSLVNINESNMEDRVSSHKIYTYAKLDFQIDDRMSEHEIEDDGMCYQITEIDESLGGITILLRVVQWM